jgi:hypothetical protein
MPQVPQVDKAEMPHFLLPGSTILKFVDGRWHDRDELPVASEMLVTGTNHGLQCFKNSEWLGDLVDRPGKRWTRADAQAFNAQISEEEWGVGLNGEPQPPWRETWVVYLVDTATAIEYTYSNGTNGARIGVSILTRRLEITRALKGQNICDRVKLESRPMPIKRLGITKQRPEFTHLEWVDLTGDGEILLQQVRQQQALLQIEHKPTIEPAAKKQIGKPVKVTVAEEIDDDLPDNLK